MNQTSDDPDSLVARVADEFRERLKQGEDPDPEEFAARYPQISEVLRGVLPKLHLLDRPPNDLHTHSEPAVSRILGDFRIIREVGRGGMGIVYEAEQISLGRRVALKVLPFAATMDPKRLQRFHNEARAAASLRHPNIVPVHAVGSERGVHFYAMDFIDGDTLAQIIRSLHQPSISTPLAFDPDAATVAPNCSGASATTFEIARLSTEGGTQSPEFFRSVARIGVQAAMALEHAHATGVVHRDIKPGNLMLDRTGHLWITDFGLARFGADGELTLSGDLLGTLKYMSPEQAMARHGLVDHRTDVYGLGAVLYEMLTGRPVVAGEDRQEILKQIAFDEPCSPRRIKKSVPAELATIVLKALQKNPADRYSAAQDLADDLQRFLDHKPIVARKANWLQKAIRWRRRNRLAATFMFALTCGIIFMIGLTAWASWERNRAKVLMAREDRNFAIDLIIRTHATVLLRDDMLRFVNETRLTPEQKSAMIEFVQVSREPTNPRQYFEACWQWIRETRYGWPREERPWSQFEIKIFRDIRQWRGAVRADKSVDSRFVYALHHAEAACRLDPENKLFETARGIALYRIERYSDALEVLAKIRETDPCAPYAIPFFAMAYFQLGHKDRAMTLLCRLHRIASQLNWADDHDARAFLDEAQFVIGAPREEPR